MKDLEIHLTDTEMLALLGETLGKNNISLEGGGVFMAGKNAIAHFLVREPDRAKAVLDAVGIRVAKISDVVIQKLKQDVPGQLGLFCREMANAGVRILAQYSDHSNQLIIVPDDYRQAEQVSRAWKKR
jgi:hypothetical protein